MYRRNYPYYPFIPFAHPEEWEDFMEYAERIKKQREERIMAAQKDPLFKKGDVVRRKNDSQIRIILKVEKPHRDEPHLYRVKCRDNGSETDLYEDDLESAMVSIAGLEEKIKTKQDQIKELQDEVTSLSSVITEMKTINLTEIDPDQLAAFRVLTIVETTTDRLSKAKLIIDALSKKSL